MVSLEEMEQSLNEISSLTRELREVIYPRFGNESIDNVKKLIILDITVCNIAKLNSLTTDILLKMNKLDEVLNCENIEVLKNTESFKVIMMDEQLYTDILYHCTDSDFGICRIDDMLNFVKLIHKNFQDFVSKIIFTRINDFGIKINTIRFFCDNGLINKINGLSNFNGYIHSCMYTQGLYLWNCYLKYQMTSAEEAINEIHKNLTIETVNKQFQIYTAFINSVKELFPNFSVNLILRVEKDSESDKLKYFHARARDMLENIILSGQYENIKFLLEFEDFKSNYSLMIFDIIFSSGGGILSSNYYKNRKGKYLKIGLSFDRPLCIKLIIKLISILDINLNLNPELHNENKVLIIDRIKNGILLFVSKTKKIDCYELIDLLITRGICKMEDTHEAFKNSSISKRHTIETFLTGYYKLVDDGSVPHIDPNMFSSFLKSFVN